jgi:hypothetical protein
MATNREGGRPAVVPPAPLCFVPVTAKKKVDDGISPERARAVSLIGTLWVNYTVIHYWMSPTTSIPGVGVSDLQQAVRDAFKEWKGVGVGLEFVEVTKAADAEIRVSFEDGGSWSYVGTDNVNSSIVRFPSPTMNFGWNIMKGRSFDTALHEVGHCLGLSHEHQNPRSGLVWNEPAVYKYYSGPPNYWDAATIQYNILRPIPARDTVGSGHDKLSVMHYPIQAGLVSAPPDVRDFGIQRAGGLSVEDKKWATTVYPPAKAAAETRVPLRPFLSQKMDYQTGEQRDYELAVEGTRTYRIGTFGPVDSNLVLFELSASGVPRFVAGDEDSGEGRNASISTRLYSDRKYVLRCRMVYGARNIASVMFF